MLEVGELIEVLKKVESEYGSDCKIVLNVNKQGKYCTNYGIKNDGTIFLFDESENK